MKLFFRIVILPKLFMMMIIAAVFLPFLSVYPQSFIEQGNRWDYIEGWWDGLGNGDIDTNSYKPSPDTMMSNGKYYNKILPGNELFNHYIRVDSSGVWYYDFECNNEWLYFSYPAAVGERRLIPAANCDTLEYAAEVIKTSDTLAVAFNDTVIRIMTFQYIELIDIWYTVSISPDIGFISWNSSDFYANYYKYLMGCKISGVNYGTLLTVVKDIEKPHQYTLAQNYPNPFNPSTKINYSLPEYSTVLIKVFDILGNEIETLVDEEKPAGKYEVTWNAADLPGGVYFYQLRTDAFVQTRKMILVK